MKNMVTMLSLMLMSSSVFAFSTTICKRGGGTNLNLPFNSYYLNLRPISNHGMEVQIFERQIDSSKGDQVLRSTVELVAIDRKYSEYRYVSADGRVKLLVNQGDDGNIFTAFVSGTGEGLDKRKRFAFEGRACSLGN